MAEPAGARQGAGRGGAYGVFLSANPVLAAVVGLVVLNETSAWDTWLGTAAIVVANAVGT